MKKTILLTLMSLLVSLLVSAQETANQAEPATGLRADQKIYVVIAVLLTILAGLFIYMLRLDRKISRFEKQENK